MESRYSDKDSSSIFWPGYVDATTNLILNLLFLLTILIIAVFMFALELGRSSPVKSENPPVQVESKNPPVLPTKLSQEVFSKATDDYAQENIALKREIERLKTMLAQRAVQKVQPGGVTKSVEATSSVPQSQYGLDKTLANDLEVIVRFKDGAIELTPEEHNQLYETLKPIVAKGKTSIYVEVPAGFSEAKRMGFYRAMAVRNVLIEMEVPKENIDVSVVERKSNANASLVRVRKL